jgi:flagellar basal-body rod modification protein FlgD
VTTVSPVSNNNAGQATSQTPAAANLDYNAFLKLLIAQLKNQDPTQPMDSTQFVSQLATFSQVQEAVSTNAKLDSLLTAQSLTVADSFIGRTVASADGETSGVVTSVKITDDGPLATLASGDTLLLGSGVTIK